MQYNAYLTRNFPNQALLQAAYMDGWSDAAGRWPPKEFAGDDQTHTAYTAGFKVGTKAYQDAIKLIKETLL